MMQMVIDDFANKKIPLQGTQDDWQEFQSHFDTLYKVTTVDALGVPNFSWESSTGLDHFCHATAYWRTGMDKFRNDGGKIFSGELTHFPIATQVSPSETMPWRPRFALPEQDDHSDWRNSS